MLQVIKNNEVSEEDILDAYLDNARNINRTAQALGIPKLDVAKVINKPEAITVLTAIEDLLYEKMEELLNDRIQFLEEAGITTSKDPVEIIAAMHKMRMEELKLKIKLSESKTPTKVSNTQVNIGLPAVLQAIQEWKSPEVMSLAHT